MLTPPAKSSYKGKYEAEIVWFKENQPHNAPNARHGVRLHALESAGRHYAPDVIAERTLKGIEAINMITKGQVNRLDGADAEWQAKFVDSLCRIAACAQCIR
jgi:hypothetical protein